MKTFGIILIVLGIAMMVITSFEFTTEEEVVDLGPLSIDKEEDHQVGWPTYAGGVVTVAGVVLVLVGRKKK